MRYPTTLVVALVVAVACAGESRPGGAPDPPAAGDLGPEVTPVPLDASDAPQGASEVQDGDAVVTPDGEGETTPVAPPLAVVVMSFNVLCSVCDPAFDPWEERIAHFADLFDRHDPDLIGLQELIFAHEVDQMLAARPGFGALFFDEAPLEYPDATILYREERFTPREHGFYWLSPTPEEPLSVGFSGGPQLARVVAWGRFHDASSGREFVFSTTHFDNNPPSQERSAPLFLERTAPWAATLPVVATGDFNSRPDSVAYGLLTEGAEAGGFHMADTFDLAETWEALDGEVDQPPYDTEARIDHVFVAGAVWRCPRWVVDRQRYGPDELFPSDHRAIVAELLLE